MLEPTQQLRPNIPLHTIFPDGVSGFEASQHPRFQALFDRMHAQMVASDGEIDREVIERFCRRMLPVTLLSWTRKL